MELETGPISYVKNGSCQAAILFYITLSNKIKYYRYAISKRQAIEGIIREMGTNRREIFSCRRALKQYYLDVDGATVCKISATHLKAAVYTTLQVIKDKQKEDPKFNPSILTIYKKDSTQSLKGDFNGQVNFCSA